MYYEQDCARVVFSRQIMQHDMATVGQLPSFILQRSAYLVAANAQQFINAMERLNNGLAKSDPMYLRIM